MLFFNYQPFSLHRNIFTLTPSFFVHIKISFNEMVSVLPFSHSFNYHHYFISLTLVKLYFPFVKFVLLIPYLSVSNLWPNSFYYTFPYQTLSFFSQVIACPFITPQRTLLKSSGIKRNILYRKKSKNSPFSKFKSYFPP